MTPNDYAERWDSLAWEMTEAQTSFYALLGLMDWQDAFLADLKNGKPMRPSGQVEAVLIFSNAMVSHFFITACRIRETTRTLLSLPVLSREAADTFPFDIALLASVKALLDKTRSPFEKIKKVRGMTVAHLHGRESPFALMKRENISTETVLRYLQDCAALYGVLGKPIGREHPTDGKSYQSSRTAVSTALNKLMSL